MSGTAASMDQLQMQRFQERLARIEKRGRKVELAPLGAVEYDAKGKPVIAQAPTFKANRLGSFLRGLVLSPFVLALSALLGLTVVMVVRFGRLFWDGGALTGEAAGQAMLLDAGISLTLLVILRALFKMRGRRSLLGGLAGLAFGVLAMHNLVHIAPSAWAMAYPAEWVDGVLAGTQPGSVLIRGVSYTF